MLKMVTGQLKPPAESSTHWTRFLTLSCSTKQECFKYQIIWQSSMAWKTTVCIAKYFPELEAHKDYCLLFSTQKYSTNMTLSDFCNMAPRREKSLSASFVGFSTLSSACKLPGFRNLHAAWCLTAHSPTSRADGWPSQLKERENPTWQGWPLPADVGVLALLLLPVWLLPCCLWKPALSLWLLWSFPSASVVPLRGTNVPDQPIWIGARPLTGEVKPNPIYLKL